MRDWFHLNLFADCILCLFYSVSLFIICYLIIIIYLIFFILDGTFHKIMRVTTTISTHNFILSTMHLITESILPNILSYWPTIWIFSYVCGQFSRLALYIYLIVQTYMHIQLICTSTCEIRSERERTHFSSK